MSLTSHLDDPDSPIRQFLLTQFPNARPPRQAIALLPVSKVLYVESAQLPASSLPRTWHAPDAVELPDAVGYPWATIGTAFDFRMRFCLGASFESARVAAAGAFQLAQHWGTDDTSPAAYAELGVRFNELTKRDTGWARTPTAETRRALARISYVLALYEQCYRAPFLDEWPIVLAGPRATLDELSAIAPVLAIEDIDAMACLFIATQPDMLTATSALFNPSFGAASSQLGGADADLILDGRLIDIKTKKKAEIERADFWQLLGYTLADVDDEYHIRDVGFYFSRYGIQVTWSLEALMELMAGAPRDLADLRQRFRAVLNNVRPLERAAILSFSADASPVSVLSTILQAPSAPRLTSERAAEERDLLAGKVRVAHSLLFRPPVSGGGKWHVAFSENEYVDPPGHVGDLSVRPSCGSLKVELDRVAKPLKLIVGSLQDDHATQCCGRCLKYSAGWFTSVRKYKVPVVGPRERWCFSEPKNPRQKWHLKRSNFYVNERSSSSVCNSYGEFKRGGAAIPAVRVRADDSRLCAHCLQIVSDGAPKWILDLAARRTTVEPA